MTQTAQEQNHTQHSQCIHTDHTISVFIILIIYSCLLAFIMHNLRQSFEEEHCFSKVALANFGFQRCLRSKLLRELYNLKPSGINSSLNDAIIVGLDHLKGLYQMVEESGRANSWKLINIIICDGKKDSSKAKWAEVKSAYRAAKARIRAYQFKTIVIAYNVTQQQYSELMIFQDLDPQILVFPASFYHSEYEELNLGKLMKKIRKDVGLIFKQPRQSDLFNKKEEEQPQQILNPYAIPQTIFSYGVLFTISGTHEYQDEIWNSLCNNINNFTRYLGDRDILGGIIYSEVVRYFKEEKFIIKEEKKKLVDPPKAPIVAPVQAVVNPYPVQHGNPYPVQNGNPYAQQNVGNYGQQQGYIPPNQYVPQQPQPQIRPPQPQPQPRPQRNPPPPPPNKHQINHSLSSNKTSKKSQVQSTQILQSRSYSICESRSKCQRICIFFITIFALLIIGGVVYITVLI